jgi:hypothetical protein
VFGGGDPPIILGLGVDPLLLLPLLLDEADSLLLFDNTVLLLPDSEDGDGYLPSVCKSCR